MLYLVVEKKNGTWRPRCGKFFNSEEDAWDWVDTHYQSDEARLRFGLVPVDVSEFKEE